MELSIETADKAFSISIQTKVVKDNVCGSIRPAPWNSSLQVVIADAVDVDRAISLQVYSCDTTTF